MQETWVQSLGWKDPLEKGKATHSSILAWRGSQRVGNDWATLTFTFTLLYKEESAGQKDMCLKRKSWIASVSCCYLASVRQYPCLENPMDGGAWKAAVHGVAEGQTWLRNFTFTFHFRALEKEMATHSSVLAWRIPGTGEPGGLPSMGSHRVGHDWSDLAAAAAGSNNCVSLKWRMNP